MAMPSASATKDMGVKAGQDYLAGNQEDIIQNMSTKAAGLVEQRIPKGMQKKLNKLRAMQEKPKGGIKLLIWKIVPNHHEHWTDSGVIGLIWLGKILTLIKNCLIAAFVIGLFYYRYSQNLELKGSFGPSDGKEYIEYKEYETKKDSLKNVECQCSKQVNEVKDFAELETNRNQLCTWLHTKDGTAEAPCKSKEYGAECMQLKKFCRFANTNLDRGYKSFNSTSLTTPTLLPEPTVKQMGLELWNAQKGLMKALVEVPLDLLDSWSANNLPKLISTIGTMSHRLKAIQFKQSQFNFKSAADPTDLTLLPAMYALCPKECLCKHNENGTECYNHVDMMKELLNTGNSSSDPFIYTNYVGMYIADGWCDEQCNKAECLYDGGDCAGLSVDNFAQKDVGFPLYVDDMDKAELIAYKGVSWISSVYMSRKDTNWRQNLTKTLNGCSHSLHYQTSMRAEQNIRDMVVAYAITSLDVNPWNRDGSFLVVNQSGYDQRLEHMLNWDDTTWQDVFGVGKPPNSTVQFDSSKSCDPFSGWLSAVKNHKDNDANIDNGGKWDDLQKSMMTWIEQVFEANNVTLNEEELEELVESSYDEDWYGQQYGPYNYYGDYYGDSSGCSNTCSYANDGECDDGGPGAMYSGCNLGTDCNDCGARQAGDYYYTPSGGSSGCSNTCYYANDGECDDGGPGATYSDCDLGTDCNDCGARQAGDESYSYGNYYYTPSGGSSGDESYSYGDSYSSSSGCSNTCSYANDGECDDGGPGATYSDCDLGTDCNDCGPRQAVNADRRRRRRLLQASSSGAKAKDKMEDFISSLFKEGKAWYGTKDDFIKNSVHNNLRELMENMFVETAEVKVDYPAYFKACAVKECSYTFSAKENPSSTLTIVLGLIGGVTTSLTYVMNILYGILRKRIKGGAPVEDDDDVDSGEAPGAADYADLAAV